jgi:hypothetical protein
MKRGLGSARWLATIGLKLENMDPDGKPPRTSS